MIKNISKIGMGTWLVEDEKILLKTIKAGIEAGYTHIDTAQVYNNEYQIGSALKKLNIDREKLFITTKICYINTKYHVHESIIESLHRLQIKQIDLILLHWPQIDKTVDVIGYKQLMKARESGLVRHVGVSNYTIQDLENIKMQTGEYPYCNQIVLSPTTRAQELEDFCKEKEIQLIGYSIMKTYFNPNPYYLHFAMTHGQKTTIDQIATKHNKNSGQILNKWALQLGYNIIPKSQNSARVISNIDLNFKLTEKDMHQINKMNKFTNDEYRKNNLDVWTSMWTIEQLEANYLKGALFKKNYKGSIYNYKK